MRWERPLRGGIGLTEAVRGPNTFDVIRLVAAVAVLVSHSYALTAHVEPLVGLTGHTLGELGVSIFFAISGFLIVRSWERQPEVRAFVTKRALRLLPALAVVAFLTAFVLGPAVTSLTLTEYAVDPQPYLYAVRSSLLVTFSGVLPGVFADNPYPDAVNGSLWTLPVEATAYAMVAVLGLLGLLRRRLALVGLCVLLVVLASPQANLGVESTTTGASVGLVLHLLGLFVAGMLTWLFRERIVLSWWIFGALALVWVLAWGTDWVSAAGTVFIPYAVLVLAHRLPLRSMVLVAGGDVSYGIYIYAFPVQQTVAHLVGPGITALQMLALSLPIAYLLAFASWRLVERPALAWKRRLTESAAESR